MSQRPDKGASGTWAPLSRRSFLRLLVASGAVVAGLAGTSAGATPRPTSTAPRLADLVRNDPIADLAEELEYDVERIFRFVADEIRYEPYVGVLRGARGTLAGRAGNSADQALLLAAILQASQFLMRIVSGPLQPGRADALMAATEAGREAAREDAMAVMRGRTAVTPDPMPAQFQQMLDRVPELSRNAQVAAEAQSASSISTILEALHTEGISPSLDTSTMPRSEQEQHIWLQIALGSEWVDLDPSLPESQLGESIATATGDPRESLADELRHRIEIVATAERIAGNGLAVETVFEFSAYADELAGRPMVFMHADPASVEKLGISILGALTGEVQYVPVLGLNDRTIVGAPISLMGGGILSELSEQLSTFGEAVEREGEATAEWLVVRTISPDGTTSSASRTIFDRIGTEARRTGPVDVAAIPPVELVHVDEEVGNEFLPLRTVQFLTVATGATSPDVITELKDDADGPGPLLIGGILYHIGRDALAATLAPARGIRMFLDRPSIVSFDVTGPESTEDESPTFSLDVLHQGFGQLAVADMPLSTPPGILAGVISNVAERLALGDGLTGDFAPESEVLSVGGLLDKAVASGIGVRVIRGSVPADLELGIDAKSRLSDALDQGLVAVVPVSPVHVAGRARSGWWLIDPATGRTTDQMDDGRGSSSTEHPIIVAIDLYIEGKWVRASICLGAILWAYWKFIVTVISIPSGEFDPAYFMGILYHGLLYKLLAWAGCH